MSTNPVTRQLRDIIRPLVGLAVITAILLIALLATSMPVMANGGHEDLGREVLAANDGWAAFGAGTTGGSLADPSQVYTVTNRAELIAALNNGVPSSTSPSNPSDEPMIIYVDGTIDMNVDDENQPPRIVACLSSPTMVVLEPIRMRTRACCALREASRASSSGPLGTSS